MSQGDDSPKVLSKKQYEKELARLQDELVQLQEWIVHAGLRVAEMVLFDVRPHRHQGLALFVVEADDKRTARLNLISYLLERIPHQPLPAEKIELPPRQQRAYVRPPAGWCSPM